MCRVCHRSLFAVLMTLAAFPLGCGGSEETTPLAPAPDAAVDASGSDSSVPVTPDGASDATTADSGLPGADGSADGSIPASDANPDGSVDGAINDSSVTPPVDAIADVGPTGEYLDDGGVCRSSQPPTFRTCAATFQAAVDAGAPVGMVRSGWCGNMLVWISYATPSLGCAYDSSGATLVARYFSDDVPAHCGNEAYGVSTPTWPASCVPAPLDAGPDAT